MKRYINSMGVMNPAHNVPAHDTYNPSIDISTFKQLIRSGNAANNATLLDGMIIQIICDINADNNAGIVNNQKIRKYYRKYYNEVSKSSIASNQLVNQLHGLV